MSIEPTSNDRAIGRLEGKVDSMVAHMETLRGEMLHGFETIHTRISSHKQEIDDELKRTRLQAQACADVPQIKMDVDVLKTASIKITQTVIVIAAVVSTVGGVITIAVAIWTR
jgi:hypothetical protein